MARGDMEQFQVGFLSSCFKEFTWDHDQTDVDNVSQIDDWSWAPVKTKMTLERSYQCAVGLSRSVSGNENLQNRGNTCYMYSVILASQDDPQYATAIDATHINKQPTPTL